MQETDKITLKNMMFKASIGVTDWERRVPTTVEIDIEVGADLRKACISDDLHDTINYSEIHNAVNRTVVSRHYNLLESLAQEVADAVLDQSRCLAVTVKVRKPNPPFPGMCAYAEVEIIRNKLPEKR